MPCLFIVITGIYCHHRESAMLLTQITNAHIVMMIALASLGTLVVALRSTHLTLFGICVRALLVDIGAVIVVMLALVLPEIVF
jgi:hypothetical protein